MREAIRVAAAHPPRSGERSADKRSPLGRSALLNPCGPKNANERKISIGLQVIEAVPDQELIGDVEPHVLDIHISNSAGTFVKEGTDLHARRPKRPQVCDQPV